MHLRLRLQNSANGPQEFTTQEASVLIGRAPHAAVVLSDNNGTISWQHARINLAPTGASIEDLGSTNGTSVNGRPVIKGNPIPLHQHDVIQFGKAGPRLQVTELILSTPVLAATALVPMPERVMPVNGSMPGPRMAPVAFLGPTPVSHPSDTPSPTRYLLMQTQRRFRWFAVGVAAAGVGTALVLAVIAFVLWNHQGRIEQLEVDVAALNEKYTDNATKIEDLREKTAEIDHHTSKMYEQIAQLDKQLAQVSAKQPAKPEDVYLRTAGSTVWLLQAHGSGSGVLIERDHRLMIATAYHVVHGANEVDVVFPKFYNGKILTSVQQYSTNGGAAGSREVVRAKVWASDPGLDLAIVELPPGKVPPEIMPLRLADSSPNNGAAVHAVGGHPQGSTGLWVYSHGYVREVAEDQYSFATSQNIKAWVIATQNPVNPGNSGGPLVNDKCELVGITSAGTPGANVVTKFIDVRHLREVLNARPQKRLNSSTENDVPPPPAEDKKPPTNTRQVHALLVILSNDRTIGLSVAEDGKQMTQLLQGGLPAGRCTITKLDGNNVKEEEIARYFSNLKVKPDDTVLCYYSGHGCMVKDNHFMVMSTGTCLPRERLRQMMSQTHARLQVLISDSCASYPPPSRDSDAFAAPPPNVLTPLLLGSRGVVDWQAASPGQYAFNAMFTPSFNNAITVDHPRTWDVLFTDTKTRTEKLYATQRAKQPPGSAMGKQNSQTPYAFVPLTAVRPD